MKKGVYPSYLSWARTRHCTHNAANPWYYWGAPHALTKRQVMKSQFRESTKAQHDANDTAKAVDTLACFAWLIHYSARDPAPFTFTPEATPGG